MAIPDLPPHSLHPLQVPTGGLFSLVTCPHYFFELVSWWGLAVVSQHIHAVGVALGMTGYLAGEGMTKP